MAHNDISPAFLKLNYNSNGHAHVQTLPMSPWETPTVGIIPEVLLKSGSSIAFDTVMDDYADLLAAILNSGDEISTAEFWYKPTPESDPLWIYTHPLAVAGDSATAAVFAQRWTMSFRSIQGGILKATMMETVVTNNIKNAYPFASTPNDALGTFFTSSGSPFFARDGGSLAVPVYLTTKTDDTLRKKYQVIS